MADVAGRIRRSADLGRAKRSFDLLLGSVSMAPLVALAILAWAAPALPAVFVRTLAVIWAGALLTFFAGVRRGLTFSEAGGGRPSELATMLGVFFVGVVSLILLSPVLAALGLAGVAVLDAMAARRQQAPLYFSVFRPPQLGLGALSLLAIALKGG
jgi:uncharacterized membrane protein